MIVQSKPDHKNFLFINKNLYKKFSSNINFTINGRIAIKEIALNLGIKKGDKILIPGFICSTAIDPLIEEGIIPIYYDIGLDLKINLDKILIHLEKKDIKAILLVNYFGILDTNKIKILTFCKQHGLSTIDDYCHSFLSYYLTRYSNKSSHGEYIAFNLNKTLRVKCGAYICANDKENKSYILKKTKTIFLFFSYIFGLLELLNRRFRLVNIYHQKVEFLKNFFLAFKNSIFKEHINNVFRLNYFIIASITNIDFLEGVKIKRRNNYKILFKLLNEIGINPIQKFEDNISVPQVLVIKDKSGKLNQFLRNNGIGSYKWPDKELPDFSSQEKLTLKNTLFLTRTLVCLPIHHSLKMQDLKYISNKINEFYSIN